MCFHKQKHKEIGLKIRAVTFFYTAQKIKPKYWSLADSQFSYFEPQAILLILVNTYE